MIDNIFSKPPAHRSISNWLGREILQRLLDFAQMRRDSFFPSGIGNKEENRVDLNARRSTKIKVLGNLKEELRARARAVLLVMFQQLGAAVFEPSKLEVEMVAHGDGAFYKQRRDSFGPGQTINNRRVISCVYYFHRLPKSFSGGVLRIYCLAGSADERHLGFLPVLVSARSPASQLAFRTVRGFALCDKLLGSSLKLSLCFAVKRTFVPAAQREVVDER
jgi:hypothetical protein